MKKKITINGKDYNVAPMGVRTVCQLENYGVGLDDMGSKNMTFLCAYIAICMQTSLEEAQEAVENHIVSGGTFTKISEAINKEVEESAFFQALIKKAQESDGTTESEESAKSK